TKSGVEPDEIERYLSRGRPEIRGLSTMPPLAATAEESRPYFRRLRELAEQHGLRELSMGTTQDYRIAAEEGATFVRVGTARYRGRDRERERPYDGGRTEVMRPTAVRPRLEAAPNPPARVHLVIPRSFNDAQQIADKFKESIPVILNLQSTDQELSKRLIDFT